MYKQRSLKMDFCSFDKDFKQLCTWGFMQEYRDHTFSHALTFAGSRGRCLNTRLIGRVLKHLPRDLAASLNAMKQTCVTVILAYFTLFHPNSH